MTKIIGLTGTISAGKSTVSKMLEEEYNAVIVDADQICRNLCEPGELIYLSLRLGIVAEGKEEIYFHTDGTLNRQALAELMFSDPYVKSRIEHMMHGHVKREMMMMAGQAIVQDTTSNIKRPIIFDAPLLIEGGLKEHVSALIVVHINQDLQLRRLMQRNGFSEEEARKRIAVMMPQEELLSHADYAIDNSGDLESLKERVRGVMTELGY